VLHAGVLHAGRNGANLAVFVRGISSSSFNRDRGKNSAMSKSESGSQYVDVSQLEWQITEFPGVKVKRLWQDEQSGAFTALFRLEPGARLPRHRHTGVEQTFVLEGSLIDEHGECTAGNFVWRSPGSIHEASSPDGCISISVFQQPNEFLDIGKVMHDKTPHEEGSLKSNQ